MSPKTFSVRIIGFTAVIGGFFGIYYLLATPLAIAHIEHLGGSVLHDTAWCATVYEKVYLNDTTATDDDLRYVRQLQPYRGIYLRNTSITDDGLKHLHGLEVYEIDLTGTNISDSAVDEFLSTIPADFNCQIKR
ncbi:hypothetical protein [Gimesia aquarii]|uniref:Leucine Rich repeats (2 copies) n=1 Tax=Gimesia aquarii TaxID=2527964 RepID=A0A517W1Z1_9PLAN|nr:hypothetical protein [Gimesia aquarii]QDT99257.1 hypothetical protein V144x_47680 [Gimesia aquarii]